MWERIESDGDGPKMRRMAVPGGWLYAEYYNTQVYPVFVPQPAEQGDKVKPTEEELGDAYARGYKDGTHDTSVTHTKWHAEQDKVKLSDLAALLDAMERLIATADSMIYPEETFRNSEYAAADEVITAARRALEAARKVER